MCATHCPIVKRTPRTGNARLSGCTPTHLKHLEREADLGEEASLPRSPGKNLNQGSIGASRSRQAPPLSGTLKGWNSSLHANRSPTPRAIVPTEVQSKKPPLVHPVAFAEKVLGREETTDATSLVQSRPEKAASPFCHDQCSGRLPSPLRPPLPPSKCQGSCFPFPSRSVPALISISKSCDPAGKPGQNARGG